MTTVKTRHQWMVAAEYVALLAVLGAMVVHLECITSLSVASADALGRNPAANRTLALMLMFSGFSLCYWILRRSRLFTIRMAFGTYVLAALGMAGVYYLVHVSHPNCYAFGADVAPSASVLDFVYFSFVTVTTLGYGDIVPNHTFVRMLVVIQILFGVMLILRAAPHPASIEAARAHENAAPPSGRPSKTTSTEEQNDDT